MMKQLLMGLMLLATATAASAQWTAVGEKITPDSCAEKQVIIGFVFIIFSLMIALKRIGF